MDLRIQSNSKPEDTEQKQLGCSHLQIKVCNLRYVDITIEIDDHKLLVLDLYPQQNDHEHELRIELALGLNLA